MKTIVQICIALSLCFTASANETYLQEDFDSLATGRLPAGWVADGPGWSVVDGRLRAESLNGQTSIRFGSSDWSDVVISADVRFIDSKEETRWAAIVLRDAGPKSPGVQFTIRLNATRSNGLELATRRPADRGKGWRVFQTTSAANRFLPGKARQLRIAARGEWISTFLDGEKIFETPIDRELSNRGQIGFCVNGATVEFDNIVVSRAEAMTPGELLHLRSQPLAIAHRGFSYIAPENTLAAYKLAIETGVEMAECDVYLTADGVPVLLHDGNVKRTTGMDAEISNLTLSQAKELDAGSWKSQQFKDERIPTLEETLKLVHGHLRLVIEIKAAGMENEVVATIQKAGVKPEEVMIFSFNRNVIETISKIEPRLPTTWLVGDMPHDKDLRQTRITEALQARCSAIGLSRTRTDPSIARMAHEVGLGVFVWTVNEKADMRRLIRMGVDAIISDRPDVLLDTLAEH